MYGGGVGGLSGDRPRSRNFRPCMYARKLAHAPCGDYKYQVHMRNKVRAAHSHSLERNAYGTLLSHASSQNARWRLKTCPPQKTFRTYCNETPTEH